MNTDPKHWQRAHEQAMSQTHLQTIGSKVTAHEAAIVGLLKAWKTYAIAHEARFESKVGDDGFLGPVWEQVGLSLLELLNGETGRLDCGTVAAAIRRTMAAHNVKEGE